MIYIYILHLPYRGLHWVHFLFQLKNVKVGGKSQSQQVTVLNLRHSRQKSIKALIVGARKHDQNILCNFFNNNNETGNEEIYLHRQALQGFEN